MPRLIVLATASIVILSGCGSSGGPGGSDVSAAPQQVDNAQRDVGYLRAVNEIMTPFSKPPTNMTDYASGARKLHVAILKLS